MRRAPRGLTAIRLRYTRPKRSQLACDPQPILNRPLDLLADERDQHGRECVGLAVERPGEAEAHLEAWLFEPRRREDAVRHLVMDGGEGQEGVAVTLG